MNLYAGILGELVIVEFFVFLIWLKVLLEVIKDKNGGLPIKRLLLTSLGLLLNAVAIMGIMAYRIYELVIGNWPFVWGIVVFYAVLTASNVLFIVAATLGKNPRLLQWFLLLSFLWVVFVTYMTYFY